MILNIMGLWGNFGTFVMCVGNSLATFWELMNTLGRPNHGRQLLFASKKLLHTLSYNREIAPTLSFTETLRPCLETSNRLDIVL